MPSPRKQKPVAAILHLRLLSGREIHWVLQYVFNILGSKFALRSSILDSNYLCCIQPALHEQK